MNQEEYLKLFEKYELGEASPEEVEILMCYEDEVNLTEWADDENEDYKEVRKRILLRLNRSIKKQQVKPYRKIWWAAAAAVVLFALVPLWKNYNQKIDYDRNTSSGNTAMPGNNIFVNKNSAMLTLADGKQIALNDIANGTISQQGNIKVQKQGNGMLQYVVAGNTTTQKVDTNTISTPRGIVYQVVLPDGTKVWLNAASSLRFPIAFNGNERKVFLSGEAYFEVAKNKQKPFKVKFNNEEVEVLGTHFNIMAYKDDKASKTTLLEGSVRIVKNNVNKMLIPGQQAISNNAIEGMRIVQADVQDVISWREGFFVLKDATVEDIMKQAERWYDVSVDYVGDVAKMKFGGRIKKYESITELLKNMEITGTIHFKIDGKKVTIMK